MLGDETLCGMARELVSTVRGNVAIDWARRENVRAQLRVLVQAHRAQVRMPARQTGEGHPESFQLHV